MNPNHLADALTRHLTTIYEGVDAVDSQNHKQLSNQLIELMGLQQATPNPPAMNPPAISITGTKKTV